MSIRRPRVLIVEDDPDLLVVLRVNLTAVGLDPILAGDGRTAISRIQAERPDAVVLDVMLPGIDGWSVLEDLHTMGDPVPIVVCSAKKNAEDMARARALGASGYVVKPFDIDRLLDAVLEAVGVRDRRTDIAVEVGLDVGVELG
ncbi:MAG TPA: response regulator [Actinomycetota bacterium]|nr:response regulator [Actinomycetota bacterium]